MKAIYPDEAKNAELDITAKFKFKVKVSWHYSIEALTVARALSTRNRVCRCSSSLLQVRTLPSRVVTSNRARHELIQLPTIMKVRLLGTR